MVLRNLIAERTAENEIFSICALVKVYLNGHINDIQLIAGIEDLYEKQANLITQEDFTQAFLKTVQQREAIK